MPRTSETVPRAMAKERFQSWLDAYLHGKLIDWKTDWERALKEAAAMWPGFPGAGVVLALFTWTESGEQHCPECTALKQHVFETPTFRYWVNVRHLECFKLDVGYPTPDAPSAWYAARHYGVFDDPSDLPIVLALRADDPLDHVLFGSLLGQMPPYTGEDADTWIEEFSAVSHLT